MIALHMYAYVCICVRVCVKLKNQMKIAEKSTTSTDRQPPAPPHSFFFFSCVATFCGIAGAPLCPMCKCMCVEIALLHNIWLAIYNCRLSAHQGAPHQRRVKTTTLHQILLFFLIYICMHTHAHTQRHI